MRQADDILVKSKTFGRLQKIWARKGSSTTQAGALICRRFDKTPKHLFPRGCSVEFLRQTLCYFYLSFLAPENWGRQSVPSWFQSPEVIGEQFPTGGSSRILGISSGQEVWGHLYVRQGTNSIWPGAPLRVYLWRERDESTQHHY